MNRICQFLVTAIISHSVLAVSSAADPEVSPYAGSQGWEETKEERTQWFKDAKFGMFIHWGLYSPAGGYWPPDPEKGKKYPEHYSEWIRFWDKTEEPEYGDLTKPLFQPDPGCTDEWAALAKEAGMKYTVLTTKHHDGYTLFNAKAPYSQQNDITHSTNISPKGRDLVAEYAKSVRDHGLKVGYYYSLIDWQHPHALTHSRPWPISPEGNHEIYLEYMHDHMRQLFSDYGQSDIMWVDYSSGNFQGSAWKTKEILDELYRLQPQALVNNRFWTGLENPYGDFFTPEKYLPPTGFDGRSFEVCHTMNESFGYSHHDRNWKSTEEVVQMLVDIASKGGNLLLNVGPDAKGHIPEESARVLRETGQWLKTYGEAIYGTEASPFAALSFKGRCTQKATGDNQTTLFLHLFEWPSDPQITMPALENELISATLVGSEQKLNMKPTDGGVSIALPPSAPNAICSVVAVTIQGNPIVDELAGLPQQQADRSVTLPSAAAQVQGGAIHLLSEQGDQPAHVSHWVNPSDTVEFAFNITRPGPTHAGGEVVHEPGRYAVMMQYAADPNGGGELKITTVNDQELVAKLEPTGGWQNYKIIKVGEITLDETGETKIKLQGSSIGSAGFINLATIKLMPIN